MLRYLLLLFFIVRSTSVFCQNQHDTFGITSEKLSSKIWVIKKECLNDSCYFTDSDYYYIPQITYSDNDPLNHGRFCFGLSHYTYVLYPGDSKPAFVYMSCSAYICFVDTLKRKNTFKVALTSEVGKENAELSFISDKEFFIYPMYGKKLYFTFFNNGNIADSIK